MRRWSLAAARIAATTRTSEKTRLVADYLRDVEPDALRDAVVFFSGRAFAESDARAAGLGWATIADAVARVAGVDRLELAAAYDRHSDLGLAIGDLMAAREAQGGPGDRAGSAGADTPPTVPDVAAAFAAIEAAGGAGGQVGGVRGAASALRRRSLPRMS